MRHNPAGSRAYRDGRGSRQHLAVLADATLDHLDRDEALDVGAEFGNVRPAWWIVDAVREVRPPFSPSAVVDDFAALLQRYRISKVVGEIRADDSATSFSPIYIDRCRSFENGHLRRNRPW
jgi:hypothetical protein